MLSGGETERAGMFGRISLICRGSGWMGQGRVGYFDVPLPSKEAFVGPLIGIMPPSHATKSTYLSLELH